MYNGHINRGVESWSLEFCRHLALLGHECALIQGGAKVDPDAPFRVISVNHARPDRSGTEITGWINRRLASVGLGPRGRDNIAFALRCLRPLLRFRPDVVVPVTGHQSACAARWYRLFNRSARILATSLGGYDETLRRADQLGIDGIVALEPTIQQRVSGGKTPVVLIPMGIDVTRFQAAPAVVNLPHPIVLSTAALEPYKRVHLAVEAAARAGMSMLVLGDGSRRQQICDLGHRLLGDRFAYHPSVPYEQVAGYYRAADVFTLPSQATEAFGVSPLEAMAAGLPVVVNDDSVRRWILGDAGNYVDPTNIQSYAAALRGAIAAHRDSRTLLERFAWPVVARRWADFALGLTPPSRGAGEPESAFGERMDAFPSSRQEEDARSQRRVLE